ncbi:hypothetical protein M2139_001252 [Enterococcus sp. PF1-24]|uniref:MucBP domain-containing protein n=1 Tax=unclassified Enterococcus TaxID=2608891 RepID=UPI002475C564|nr:MULTISPECIES: MucBP domain-containing protein [unclassified Enterococcus]MDH6364273.1 hypothetical protein [Enterococcus sp. PFB1-1]MDH6401368.1 hypothetical protein [Enterococcus sp. PF1-24]
MFKKIKISLFSIALLSTFSLATVTAEAEDAVETSLPTVRAAESIDDWMPDKTLQRMVADKYTGGDVSLLTPEILAGESIQWDIGQGYPEDDELLTVVDFTGMEKLDFFNISVTNTNFEETLDNIVKTANNLKYLHFYDNLNLTLPNGLDFSKLNMAEQVFFWDCFYTPKTITLDQNNYSDFSKSYDELGLLNLSGNVVERSIYEDDNYVPVSESNPQFSYAYTPSTNDVSFSFDPEAAGIVYDTDLAGKTFTNDDSQLESEPFIRLTVDSPENENKIDGDIFLHLNFEYLVAKTESSVIAKYGMYDAAGNWVSLADDVITPGLIGTDYTTTQKIIAGYTFVKVIGEPTGKYAEEDVTVTYVYKKKPSTPSEPNNPDTPGSVPDEVLLPVWRAYNFGDGDHLYTTSRDEYDWIVGLGWQAEGIAFHSVTPAYENALPVYRLYNPNSGEHFYTLSKAEYEAVAAEGWNKEGIGYYMVPENLGYAIYRVFNPNATGPGSHLFTKSREEADWLISLGWEDEGIAFYSAR